MNAYRGYAIPDPWAQPGPPSWALSEVRARRSFALALDLILISVLFVFVLLVLLVLGLFTFGLSWALIPFVSVYPVVALVYNGASIAGPRMATPGMRAFDLEMRLTDGHHVPFLNAAAHALFFYLSLTMLTPFILLISLLARDKRCLHDILAGVVVTRRL